MIIVKSNCVVRIAEITVSSRGISAYNFLGIILFVDETAPIHKQSFIQHERIHSRQYLELLWIGFLLLYLILFIKEYFKFKDRKKAYYAIAFECEAYEYEAVPDYLSSRKLYAWKRWI